MSKSIVELVQHGEGPFTDDQGNACKLFQYKFKNGAQQFFSDDDEDEDTVAAADHHHLTLYTLPGDIYDAIAAFLPNPDLFHFLVLSRHLSVAPHVLRRRQHQKWARFSLWQLARDGDLHGVQYLHRLGTPFNTEAMDHAACKGHLAVVEFLHSVGVPRPWGAKWDAQNKTWYD